MTLGQYYAQRFASVFRYTKKNFFYCVGKTLCLIVGLPVFLATFVCELAITLVNFLFSVIPILNVVVGVICKALLFVLEIGYVLCVLPDVKSALADEKRRRLAFETPQEAQQKPTAEAEAAAEQSAESADEQPTDGKTE